MGNAGGVWRGLVPVMEVSSVTADGFTELRAFLSKLSPPEPLEAMYKEARGKATEVRGRVEYSHKATGRDGAC